MSNYDLIEGPWGGPNGDKYTFRRARPGDADKIIKHIQDYFLRDEPTSKLVGYTDEYGEEFGELTRKLIQDGFSFWIEDNETGDVASVRITFRHTRNTTFDGVRMNSKAFKVLYQVVEETNKGCDLFDYYKIDEYADFFVASCATKYRRQGLASEMYRRCIIFLAAEGFKMAKSVFTSPYTRAAARNLGFEEVYRIDYKDMKDVDGNPIFDNTVLTDEHYAANLCKRM